MAPALSMDMAKSTSKKSYGVSHLPDLDGSTVPALSMDMAESTTNKKVLWG